jgi:hypothetical protein
MEFVTGFAVGVVVLACVWLWAAALCNAVIGFVGLQDRDP